MRRVRILMLCLFLVPAAGCGSDTDEQAAEALRQRAQTHAAARESIQQRDDSDAAAPAAGPRATEAGGPGAAAGAQPADTILSDADRESFERLADALPGSEAIAVSSTGLGQAVETVGGFSTGVAWSTAKVPVAMAALDQGVATPADLRAAITASDNAAAERLFSALGPDAAAATTAQLRAAGDAHTSIQSERLRPSFTAFGQSDWRVADQARFAAGLSCVAAGSDVLDLMRRTIATQRWGLGHIGSSPAIKGGWGPGITPGNADGWLERQLGVVRIGGRPVAIAIASTAPNHAAGTRALDRLASWAAQHVSTGSAAASPRC